jgi:hypothetical protein
VKKRIAIEAEEVKAIHLPRNQYSLRVKVSLGRRLWMIGYPVRHLELEEQ